MPVTEILIVEDDPAEADTLKGRLEDLGYKVAVNTNSHEGIFAKTADTDPDVILMHLDHSENGEEIDTAEKLHSNLSIPVIFLGERLPPNLLNRADEVGLSGFVAQPCEDCELRAAVEITMAESMVKKDLTRALDEVEAANREWQRTMDAVPDMIAVVDTDFNLRQVNRATADALGVAPREAVGLKCYKAFHGLDEPPEDCPHAQTLSDGHPHSMIREEPCLGGWFDIRTAPIYDEKGNLSGSAHVVRDITERRQMEELVRQADRMEGLRIMAGSIAHNFNNMLHGVLGYIDLSRTRAPKNSDIERFLRNARESAERAATMSTLMLTYVGQAETRKEKVRLSTLFEWLPDYFKSSYPSNISLEMKLSAEEIFIQADPGQMRQMTINLFSNAVGAIGKETGRITLSSKAVSCAAEDLDRTYIQEELKPGRYVELAVSDTGCGIEKKHLRKVFDPFFTENFIGQGLGLATVLGIVRGHRGTVSVESELGKGTTVKVLLPVVESPASVAGTPEVTGGSLRGRTILVVDDESMIRDVVGKMLEQADASVLIAGSGAEAIEIFGKHADEIECILLDLTMPGMSGRETLKELRDIQQDVKIILSSGYEEPEATSGFDLEELAGFLHKPYEMSELLKTVGEALPRNNSRTAIAGPARAVHRHSGSPTVYDAPSGFPPAPRSR